MPKFLATIHVILDAESDVHAIDGVSDTLAHSGGFIFDWAYQKVDGEYTIPKEIILPEDYEEGEAFE